MYKILVVYVDTLLSLHNCKCTPIVAYVRGFNSTGLENLYQRMNHKYAILIVIFVFTVINLVT